MQCFRTSAVSAGRRFTAVLASAVLAGLLAGACAKSETPALESRLGTQPNHYAYKGGRHDGNGSGYGSGHRKHLDAKTAANAFKTEAGDIVYFSSDSSEIAPEGQQTLSAQVKWLQTYPEQTVTVEGHADERGTREYNIALGARRASSVKVYLSSHGVNASRIRTISYGKERPVVTCDDISCWSKNRRAQTVLGATAISRN
jgi:peptidoglycan-associated lipoprotein